MKLMNISRLDLIRWITLTVSMIAGMWCATQVAGQVDGQSVVSPPTQTQEIEGTWIVGPAEGELQGIDPTPTDQVVMTQKLCGRAEPVCVSNQDEIWLVSARQSHLNPCDLSLLSCCWLQDGVWQEASIDELARRHQTDKTLATTVYAHGNRTNLLYAKARGLQVYQAAFQNSPCPRPPIRYVMFAWKSEKEIRRPIADFGNKAKRAANVGKTLGLFLEQLQDRNLVIIGFSLGTQVVMSGATCSENQNTGYGRFRVALLAPALDPGFVQSEMRGFAQNSLVSETKVFINRCDRAIKAAQLIVRKRVRSSVTTLSDLARVSGSSPNPIKVFDITGEISRRHSVTRYVASSTFRSNIAQMLFDVHDSAILPTTPGRNEIEDAAPGPLDGAENSEDATLPQGS